QRAVLDRARERTDLVEAGGKGDEAVPAHAAVRRLHTDHSAQGRGLANGTTGVTAQREHRLARGDRRSASPGAPAWHPIEVPGVAGREVARVLGRAAHGELIAVRDAEH